MCSGAIVNSRIDKVVYGCPDAKAGGAESIFNIISNPNLNHTAQVVSGVCEAECAQVMKDFSDADARKTGWQRLEWLKAVLKIRKLFAKYRFMI